MAADVEGSMRCRKCESGKFVLAKNKKCRPGKNRKEETVEKMGPNGWPGNLQ